jgi:hypothetical protein
MNSQGTAVQQAPLQQKPVVQKVVQKIASAPKSLWLKLLVALYNNRTYHWIVAIPLAPLDTLFGLFYKLLYLIWPIRYWQQWQKFPEPHFPLPLVKDDVPVQTEACDACGRYLTTMIATYSDVERVRALLPEGLSLDPLHIHEGPNGKKQHAVMLMFGYTLNLRRAFWPLPGMSYLEFLVGVPHVVLDDQKVDDRRRFFYAPVLHLNHVYPTILGLLVGYRKRWSRVWATENTYTVRSLITGRPILEATFTPNDSPETKDPPQLDHWKELLDQVNVNPFGQDKLFLHFHWAWNFIRPGDIRPVSAKLRIYEDVPGMSTGDYQFEGMNLGQWFNGEAPQGAVRFSSPFELLPPFSLKLLEKADAPIVAAKLAAAASQNIDA